LYLIKHGGGTIQKIKETGTAQPKAFMLNKFTNNICEGTPLQLQALFHPDLSYQWRKDAQDIPNAIGANYNAFEAGNYDLIVRDTTNQSAIPDTSTTISINIILAKIDVLLQDSYTVDIGDGVFSIDANIPLVDATYSGTGVTPDGFFTPAVAGEGIYEIVLTITTNDCPQRDTAIVTVTNLMVGIENIALQPEIKLFPNPAKDNLAMQSNMLVKSITVYDMLGKVVLHEKVNAFTHKIGLNNMLQGMYFVKAESVTTSTIQKVIIE